MTLEMDNGEGDNYHRLEEEMWSYTFNGPPILDSRFDRTLYANAMPKLHYDDIVSEMMYDLRYEVRKEIKNGWAFDCERKLDDIG